MIENPNAKSRENLKMSKREKNSGQMESHLRDLSVEANLNGLTVKKKKWQVKNHKDFLLFRTNYRGTLKIEIMN